MEKFDQHSAAAGDISSKIDGVLEAIDNGNVFKTIIVYLFRIMSFAILIGGVFICVSNLFGDSGYFSGFDSITGFQKFTAIIGLIIGLVLCLLTVYVLFKIIKNRADQLLDTKYENIVHYIYKETVPKFIVVYGEIMSFAVLLVGVITFFAYILGSLVYFPIADIPSSLGSLLDLPFRISSQVWILGDWGDFSDGMKMSVSMIVMSGVLLIATYVTREVYFYGCKLVVNLINFLPKFAIPLAIRKRNE